MPDAPYADSRLDAPNRGNGTAQLTIRRLLDGETPDGTKPQQCEPWAHVVSELYRAHATGGTSAVRQKFLELDRVESNLADLLQFDLTEVLDLDGDAMSQHFGDVEWCWQPWIPRGHVTLIVGPSGIGKSYLIASLIAAFTGNAKFPDDTPSNDPGNIVLVETESFRGPYLQRLRTYQVPPSMVRFPVRNNDPNYICQIVEDTDLIGAIIENRDAKAVFIDSLSGGHPLDENSSEMRTVLQAVNKLSAKHDLPIIIAHHTRKKSAFETDKASLDKVRGSTTISQFARSVIGMWRPDPSLPDIRVDSIKNSFAMPPEGFGITIRDQEPLNFHDAPTQPYEETQTDKAVELLRVKLSKGPRPRTDLIEMAEQLGISRATLDRAAKKLHLSNVGGLWSFPERAWQQEIDPRGNPWE